MKIEANSKLVMIGDSITDAGRDQTSGGEGLFEAYGNVQFVTLVLDKQTGSSKGFGFVEMPKAGEAKAAMKSLNGKDVNGNKIRVKKAESKPSAGSSD